MSAVQEFQPSAQLVAPPTVEKKRSSHVHLLFCFRVNSTLAAQCRRAVLGAVSDLPGVFLTAQHAQIGPRHCDFDKGGESE
jgi:hypothetical protein